MKAARPIVRTSAGSILVGKMPRGCRLCVRGAKLVLFVTGICKQGCFYCPISEKRRGVDVTYANERHVRNTREIAEEATLMDALGTGITGGDPLVRFGRTTSYIKFLKKKFGSRHHIHMYCCASLSTKKLLELKQAGLDEIRFHLWSAEPVRLALEAGIRAGLELPAIPSNRRRYIDLLKKLDQLPGAFVNLNELEFSDTNLKEFKKRKFKIKSETSMAVKGSEELAFEILRWAASNTDLDVHYCPSSLKDSVQLRNRLKRRAANVAKPYEQITEDGLLFKGVITGVSQKELAPLRKRLIIRYKINPEFVGLDKEKGRIELHWRLAEKLAKAEPKLKFALVEEYPTCDRLETTVIPLPANV